MATLRIYADQIEENYLVKTLVSPVTEVSSEYTDKTNEDYAEVSRWLVAPYQYRRNLEFRIPAQSILASVTINSVTVSPYLRTQMDNADNLRVHVSDEAHAQEATSSIVNANSTGRKTYDVTSLFTAYVAANDGVFYVRLEVYLSTDDFTVYCNNNTDTYKFYVDIDFTGLSTACTAPTSVSIDSETKAPNAEATLSFSGMAPGAWNAITGAAIYRATSSAGPYSYLKEIATTETYGSTTVLAPAVPGQTYYYKVMTLGAEDGLDSGLSAQYAALTAITSNCVAPGVITFNELVTATPPMMTWGSAYGGLGNAITAYQLQYSESADNVTWGGWVDFKTVYTSSTGGSALVPIAAVLGHYRRYRIKTIGTLVGYDSDWSTASASVRTSSSTASQMQIPRLIVYEYPHIVEGIEKGAFPLGMIKKYNTLIIRRRYQGIGEISLSLPFSVADVDLLKCGNLIKTADGRGPYLITEIVIEQSNGLETMSVRAKDLSILLAMRVITVSSQSEDYPSGLIEGLLRAQPIFCDEYNAELEQWEPVINADMGADGDRRFPDFHWRAPSIETETAMLVYQPELLSPMLDEVIALCKIDGLGLRVLAGYENDTSDTLTLWFELYKGINRSVEQDVNPHVVFDEKLGNIKTQYYSHNIENQKTAGYATNGAINTLLETDLRLIDLLSDNAYSAGDQEYINSGDNPANIGGGSGISRKEIGLTISEITEPASGTTDEKVQALYDSCKRVGRNEIAKAVEERIMSVETNTKKGPQYMSDFDVGDIVTVRNDRYGVSMNARITEAEEIYEPGKNVQITLIFGEAAITLLGRMKQIARRRG